MIRDRVARHRPSLKAYLELMRFPNVFTSIADVTMGFLFVRPVSDWSDWLTLSTLMLTSSLFYASGMVLNDLFDVEVDLRERPERPLPSRKISLHVARWLGWTLLVVAVLLTFLVGLMVGEVWPGTVGLMLASCIVLYNAFLKQTTIGPVAMGACRMLNVLLGMSVVSGTWGAANWFVAGGIGTYIVGVTWFSRDEAGKSRRFQLFLATIVIIAGICLLARFPYSAERIVPLLIEQPKRWDLLMILFGAMIGWRCLRAVILPSPWQVQMAVRHCILSLVILDAAICFAVRGMLPAVCILVLLIPAVAFGRWIYST